MSATAPPATSSTLTSFEQGKNARQTVPRSAHAGWSPSADRKNPVAIIAAQDATRVQSLVPIRHQRMAHSPFPFYRGTAAIMAADLAATPVTGANVQACGDAHLANFGAFATPELNYIFDVNDFDETLHAPWEWDVKRLAASAVLAARELGLGEKRCHKAALAAVTSYRKSMADYAAMTALDVWYSRISADELVARMRDAVVVRDITKEAQLAHDHLREDVSPHLVSSNAGELQIRDDTPLVFHFKPNEPLAADISDVLAQYSMSLRDDLRVLFGRYHKVDLAAKVVGVGSVGTRCAVALFQAAPGDVLTLQIKEAMASVLEPYAGTSGYTNHGERVVTGQRLTQKASDIFLGWAALENGQHYYIRQLRDMKAGVDLTRMREVDMLAYASLCGRALACAHARSGDAAFIAGYLGNSTAFDEAVSDFAAVYANQADQDYTEFIDAIKSGRLTP